MEVNCDSPNSQQASECVAIPIDKQEDSLTESSSSTPFVPSRFLCPSNLGALLESTTVSLSGWKDTTLCEEEGSDSGRERHPQEEGCRVVIEDGCYVIEDTAAGDDVEECATSIEEIQVQDATNLPTAEAISTELQQPDLPQLIPPAPLQSSHNTATPPFSRYSPLAVPHATLGETHRQCCSSDVDLRRHHQLCIAIDEDSPVDRYLPSFIRSSSQKGSTCSPSLNDGELPRTVRHEYMTHSRNVSETPSLPPFHSSSTSSAYHSRNSSLGSQFSSCFESDSMLNQLTDMDSCSAVQSGSHNDLKQLIKKQDSRLCRKGDSSPSSYSSDLSLHQYMSKPLDRKEAILNMSPLNLEDTLRNLSSEKLDECKRNVSMKSSEWIKHQLESHRDSLVIVKVSSKTKHVVHFNVKAGDVIIWEFATKKKDIAFGVSFEATEVALEQSPVPDSDECVDNKMSSILPIFRVSTHAHPTIGTHTAALDGIYEIIFDNTYSRFFAKELYYRITTQPSQPNANYSQQ